MIHSIALTTQKRDQMLDITRDVQHLLDKEKISDGVCIVYSPHTTAGICINENADPDVVRDVLMRLDEVFPWEHPKYRHAEGNTASHLKAITTGTSQTILVQNGKLVLGTWQGIYFCEFDGPRNRTCLIRIAADA
ncbi:secondary thiamine-phosphate synthase enzyme YjbQ [Marinicrinis sediminis]|uniref:Secondary thiamine-phosphate synthase enzyme YjbQ n=1 Tax=Marinicrinis sediminis TaxID=1652465 RepID=A0ABW5R8F7_9BACL